MLVQSLKDTDSVGHLKITGSPIVKEKTLNSARTATQRSPRKVIRHGTRKTWHSSEHNMLS